MLRILLAGVIAFSAAATLKAQDPPPPTAVSPQESASSRPAIQAQLDAWRADESLPAELKGTLVEIYGRALDFAKTAESNQAATAKFVGQTAAAPKAFAELRGQLDAVGEPGHPTPRTALPELEQELATRQLQQSTAANEAVELEKETRRRTERRTSAPATIDERKKQLEALPDAVPDAPDADPRLQTARRTVRQAERARLQSEVDSLTAELAAYDAEKDLLRARRDLAERRATKARAEVEAWQVMLQVARAAAAQQAAQQQAQQVEYTDSRIVALAAENAHLAQVRQQLTERLAAAEREATTAKSDLDRLTTDYNEVTERVRVVGSTDAVGALLRQRRTWLSDQSRSIQQRSRNRGERIADTQLLHFDIRERRQRMNRQLARDWLQEELGKDVHLDDLPIEVQHQADELRRQRQELLTQLDDDYATLLRAQKLLETEERDITARIADYRAFLAEHVLGIRSSSPIWRLDTRAIGEALVWFADAPSWVDTISTLSTNVFGDIWPAAILILLAALAALRPWLRRRLTAHGDLALRGSNISYLPTALALLDTCLLAIPLPALLWFLSWRLTASLDTGELGKALANGTRRSATLLALLSFLRTLVGTRGLGEAHFRWQTSTLKQLRRNLPLLLPAAFPLSFLVGALESRGTEAWLGSLGMLALLAMFALVLTVAWRTLHPATGLIGAAMQGRPTALHRFRRVWFLLGFGTPLTLFVMAAMGYDYTVSQLSRRMLATVAVVAFGVLVHAFVLRGLVLERRRLQIRQAQERLAAARQGDAVPTAGDAPPLEEIDPQSLARQTQTLLRGALTIAVLIAAYQIWVDVLPALGILRRVPLWKDDSNLAQVVTITLADLLLSLSVLVAAFVGARNLPALLELLVLQRFKMQAGERHAVSTLARYSIIIVGILLAFSSVGIGWSKVQWLVAAVSVGLGFGLQEIFANFVSGLILLFERPIRVGDIVSVGDVTGRVNRIRIRATTIQDWERKELVVPNREFVTGHFVNWTLSDSVVRWTIPVGIAYGSDTQRALELLSRAATESPHVLRDPRHEAVFVKFGDSTLDLQLRVFVDMAALDYRWMTDLHQAIDLSFRQAGIEIAFPQREVHLRATGPLLDVIQRAAPARAAGAES